MAIYRYFSNPSHYDDFINDGKVYFNSLSHFILSTDPARADKTEGSLHHKPTNGLGINNLTNGQFSNYQSYFIPRINKPDRMFIFCASNKLDEVLFKKFNSSDCIEFLDLKEFENRLAKQITKLFNQLKIRNKKLITGAVKYYDNTDELKAKYACPDLIVLSKPRKVGGFNFAEEEEYRFVFAKDKNAFDFHDGLKVKSISYTIESHPKPPIVNPTSIILTLGNLSDICKKVM